MKKKERSGYSGFLKAGGLITAFLICIIAAVVVLSNVSNVALDPDSLIADTDLDKPEVVLFPEFLNVDDEPTETKMWRVIDSWPPLGAEADPGSGSSGILSVYFVNYTGGLDPPSTNDSNDLETWAANVGATPSEGYNNTDDFRQQLQHSTTFYIIVRIRANATHAKRTVWQDTDVRVRWTASDFSIGADTVMSSVVTANNSNYAYIWMNFYDTNSGSGFSLTKGQVAEDAQIDSIKLEAYY